MGLRDRLNSLGSKITGRDRGDRAGSSSYDSYQIAVFGDRENDSQRNNFALQIAERNNFFNDAYDPIIEDSYRRRINLDDRAANLSILDTAGQEEYPAMRDQYLRSSDGFFYTINLSASDHRGIARNIEENFQDVRNFVESINRAKDTYNFRNIILIGYRPQAESLDRIISNEQAKALATELNISYFEVNERGVNVDESLHHLIRRLRGVVQVREQGAAIDAAVVSAIRQPVDQIQRQAESSRMGAGEPSSSSVEESLPLSIDRDLSPEEKCNIYLKNNQILTAALGSKNLAEYLDRKQGGDGKKFIYVVKKGINFLAFYKELKAIEFALTHQEIPYAEVVGHAVLSSGRTGRTTDIELSSSRRNNKTAEAGESSSGSSKDGSESEAAASDIVPDKESQKKHNIEQVAKPAIEFYFDNITNIPSSSARLLLQRICVNEELTLEGINAIINRTLGDVAVINKDDLANDLLEINRLCNTKDVQLQGKPSQEKIAKLYYTAAVEVYMDQKEAATKQPVPASLVSDSSAANVDKGKGKEKAKEEAPSASQNEEAEKTSRPATPVEQILAAGRSSHADHAKTSMERE